MDARMRTKFKDAHNEPLVINNKDLLQDNNIEKVIDKKSEGINLELQKDLKVNSNLHILNSDLDSIKPQIITPKTENEWDDDVAEFRNEPNNVEKKSKSKKNKNKNNQKGRNNETAFSNTSQDKMKEQIMTHCGYFNIDQITQKEVKSDLSFSKIRSQEEQDEKLFKEILELNHQIKTGNSLGLDEIEEDGKLIQTPCLCFRRNFMDNIDDSRYFQNKNTNKLEVYV